MNKRRTHSVEFKIEVIEFAEKHSNRETGRNYKVDKLMVRRWVKEKAKLKEADDKPGQKNYI